jgi:UPF0755 protein
VKRVVIWSAVALAVALAGAIGAISWMIDRDDRLPAAAVDVVIPSGSDVADIGRQLAADGVIAQPALLTLYFRLHGGGDRLQAAEYTFPAHVTVRQAAIILEAGGRQPAVWITVPEGFTASQIGEKLERAGLVSASAFAAVTRSTPLLLPGGVVSNGLEGYLFPDTYQIPKKTSAEQVAAIMTGQFKRELPADAAALAHRLGLTVTQVVTIASMIEREAKVDRDRPLIASVIYNRLHLGMPLEIDATIEYALPRHKAELSFADLAVDSPYNTYRHAGLPPTPIANPGRASLMAALHPADTRYLYYVYKGGGRHEFSTTLEEQQQNERRFLP